jgi:hypothetical protein
MPATPTASPAPATPAPPAAAPPVATPAAAPAATDTALFDDGGAGALGWPMIALLAPFLAWRRPRSGPDRAAVSAPALSGGDHSHRLDRVCISGRLSGRWRDARKPQRKPAG